MPSRLGALPHAFDATPCAREGRASVRCESCHRVSSLFGQPNLRFSARAGDSGAVQRLIATLEHGSTARKALGDNALRAVQGSALCGCATRQPWVWPERSGAGGECTMREAGVGQSGGVVDAAGEQPRSESLALAGALPPQFDGVPPQGGGGGAEGEPADPAGLGRADHFVGGAPGDGQHITVEVGELQGHQLAVAGRRNQRPAG